MTVFTTLLGTRRDDDGLLDRFFLLQSTNNPNDVAAVVQTEPGGIYQACLCGMCSTPSQVYINIKIFEEATGQHVYEGMPEAGGELDTFLKAQKEALVGLEPYFKKKRDLSHHRANDTWYRSAKDHWLNKVIDLKATIAKLQEEILKAEAQIPVAEEELRAHESIIVEGEPEIPHVPVVRLEMLLVEGLEMQQLLFPSTTE